MLTDTPSRNFGSGVSNFRRITGKISPARNQVPPTWSAAIHRHLVRRNSFHRPRENKSNIILPRSLQFNELADKATMDRRTTMPEPPASHTEKNLS